MKKNTPPFAAGALRAVPVLAALLVAACANEVDGQAADVSGTTPDAMTPEERLEKRRALASSKFVEAAPTTADTAVTGEVPRDLLDKIMADLAQRTGGSVSEFTVIRGEAVQWGDGSLGCAEPGQMYTQAVVYGYHVVIEYAGTNYDYRASARGFFKLCPGPQLRQ